MLANKEATKEASQSLYNDRHKITIKQASKLLYSNHVKSIKASDQTAGTCAKKGARTVKVNYQNTFN